MRLACVLRLVNGSFVSTVVTQNVLYSAPRNSMIQAVLKSPNYRWWAFAAVALGLYTGVLDQSSLNIAIPSIASHFAIDIPSAQWILLAYMLVISLVLMPAGRLSDIFGRKRVYLTGLAIFAVGGILASISPNLPSIIAFKALQGVGNGMMTANNMAIMAAIFPSERRGQAMGLMNTTVGLGSITGPMLGGSLVTSFGWRSVFFFGVVLSVVGIVAVLAIVEESRIAVRREGPRPTFDKMGAGLSSLALLLLLLALTNAQRMGWLSPIVLVGIPGFAVTISFFIGWELKARSPMLDLRLFTRKVFTLAVIARAMAMLGSSSVYFLMPFYLQGVLSYSASKAGLIIVSSSSGMALAALFSGRLSDRFGWKPFLTGGLALVTTGLLVMSRVSDSTPIALIAVGLAFQGLGMGTFISPNLSAVLGAVEVEKHGVTTALVNLIRTATNLIGVAMATAIVSGVMVQAGFEPRLDVSAGASAGVSSAFTAGMRWALIVMGGCVGLGCITTLFMMQPKSGASG